MGRYRAAGNSSLAQGRVWRMARGHAFGIPTDYVFRPAPRHTLMHLQAFPARLGHLHLEAFARRSACVHVHADREERDDHEEFEDAGGRAAPHGALSADTAAIFHRCLLGCAASAVRRRGGAENDAWLTNGAPRIDLFHPTGVASLLARARAIAALTAASRFRASAARVDGRAAAAMRWLRAV